MNFPRYDYKRLWRNWLPYTSSVTLVCVVWLCFSLYQVYKLDQLHTRIVEDEKQALADALFQEYTRGAPGYTQTDWTEGTEKDIQLRNTRSSQTTASLRE